MRQRADTAGLIALREEVRMLRQAIVEQRDCPTSVTSSTCSAPLNIGCQAFELDSQVDSAEDDFFSSMPVDMMSLQFTEVVEDKGVQVDTEAEMFDRCCQTCDVEAVTSQTQTDGHIDGVHAETMTDNAALGFCIVEGTDALLATAYKQHVTKSPRGLAPS